MDRILAVMFVLVLIGVGFVAGRKYQRENSPGDPIQPADAIFGPQPSPAHSTPNALHPVNSSPTSDQFGPLSKPYKPPKPMPAPKEIPIEQLAQTTYRGFYRTAEGQYRRIQFHNGEDQQFLTVETTPNRQQTWRSDLGDLDLIQNSGSYTLTLPGREVKLGFQPARPVSGLEGQYRIMTGSLRDPSGKQLQLAMVEAFVPELEDLKQKNEFIWPALGAIQNLMSAQTLLEAQQKAEQKDQ